MRIRGEARHVNANYRKNGFCTVRSNTGNGIKRMDSVMILVMHVTVDFVVKRSNVATQFINVLKNHAQHLFL